MMGALRFLVKPTILFLVVYPLLDLIVRRYPFLAPIGYGWILVVFIMVFGVAAISFRDLVSQAGQERQWWTVTAVVVWLLFIVGAAVPERLMSDENIFEFGCPQRMFRESPDLGFLQQCFIGYPTRSFLLQVLPVQLFGFSPFVANLGASLLLLPGIVLLARAIRIATARARAGDFITGLLLLFLFQCTVFIRVIYYHDQTTHPVALTMIFIGLIALWLERSDRLAFFSLLALSLVSTAMYPPFFAVLCLLIFSLGWALLRKRLPKGSAAPLLLTVALAAVSIVQTMSYRLDLRFGVDQAHIQHLPERLQQLGLYLVTQGNGFPYGTLMFRGIFLGFLVFGLLGRFGRLIFIFCCWSTGVIVMSFFVGGMSPELAWWNMTGMHRALPVFPFFIVILAIALSKRIEPYRLSNRAISFLLFVVIAPAVWSIYNLFVPLLPPLSFRVWQVAQKLTPPGVEPKLTLMTRLDIAPLGELPKHYLYLDPKRTFEYFAGSCLPTSPVPPYTLVVTADDPICKQDTRRDGFQEVAAWGMVINGEGKLSPNMVRVYRSTASPN
jgi:hypothetical protein